MKKYNIKNYLRYKHDLKSIFFSENSWHEYSRTELVNLFLPLVENIARKFATSEQASGVLSINDLIQEGNLGLIQAVDRIDWVLLNDSDNIEQTLKAFLSKRIRGSIRRSIDINRGNIKIPEHKLNQIRKNADSDKKLAQMFFNSLFLSIDEQWHRSNEYGEKFLDIADLSEKYNITILNSYLIGIMKKYLSFKEYEVLRMSFGLNCDKYSATVIAAKLNIEGVSAYVRVSEIKKGAINKLIENVDPDHILNFI